MTSAISHDLAMSKLAALGVLLAAVACTPSPTAPQNPPSQSTPPEPTRTASSPAPAPCTSAPAPPGAAPNGLQAKWGTLDASAWQASLDGYASPVPIDRLQLLNAVRRPFASYVNTVHTAVHPVFRDSFIEYLEGLPATHRLNDQTLAVTLELVLEPTTGGVTRMGVIESSGQTDFDVGALESVKRAAPFGAAPPSIASVDGQIYLRWKFHRDPIHACSAYFARPFLLSAKPAVAQCQAGSENALALSLVLDSSGSMSGAPMAGARDAAKAAIRAVAPRDFVSVIAFDVRPRRLAPIARRGNGKVALNSVDGIGPGGGTEGRPALEMAMTELGSSAAKRRHVIFLTDGRMPTRDFKPLLARIRSCGITVSTVALGQGADATFLKSVASQGAGRFSFVSDPRKLTALFAAEVRWAKAGHGKGTKAP